MRTRDVLRWYFAPHDLVQLAFLTVVAAIAVSLEMMAERLERWMDKQ